MRSFFISVVVALFLLSHVIDSFSLVMMAARRGKKGNLKRSLDDDNAAPKNLGSLNRGKGQEITGVTLPAEGMLKGWEFGEGVRMVCCNVEGRFYAIQGDCPRCAFDLWKGDLITDEEAWKDTPRVACPTCSTTYSMRTGKYGPPFKRTGLQGFVSNLAQSATMDGDAMKNAKAFQITRDEDGKVFCRSR